MEKINKKYRCIPDFQLVKGEWDFIFHSTDKNGVPHLDPYFASIYCYNGKVIINRYNANILQITVFASKLISKIKQDLINNNVQIVYELVGDGEGFLHFYEKDLDIVAKLVKAKEQAKGKVAIFNKRNLSYFLRIMRNINSKYEKYLKTE